MKIAVTTPTGNIGRKLVGILQDQGGHELVLLARKPERLAEEQKRGAVVVEGDLYDDKFVQGATQGVDVLFWLAPPDPGAQDLRGNFNRLARIAAAVVRENRIPRVVHLSSVGAHRSEKVGPVNGLYDAEGILNATDAHVTHLRAAYFMENFLSAVGGIQQAGAVFLPVPGSVRIPMIATQDIAVAAAKVITDDTWQGKRVLELHGAADLSFDEAARAISEVAGRQVKHVEVTPDQALEAMTGLGMSGGVAGLLVELYAGLGSGWLATEQPRSAESTTPTTFAQFARDVVAPAIQATPSQGA
ncbi:MAG: NmrA family NAD(P)-binding protein [Candidatus Krumholzibacteriia bacterium]